LPHSILLLNSGGGVLLNDGTSFVLLNAEGPAHITGGSSGGRIKKKVGQRIINDVLGPRPVLNTDGVSTSRILLRVENRSLARLVINHTINSTSKIRRYFEKGYSLARLSYRQDVLSESKTVIFMRENTLKEVSELIKNMQNNLSLKTEKSIGKLKRLLRLQEIHSRLEFLDGIDGMFDVKPVILSFEFNETVHNEQLIAFTHTSSWIGNVRWNSDTLEMRILMNGKAYNFCGVPARLFDAFQGAPSKGEFYWRELRQLYSC
jgi:hypothetical protein